MLHLKEAKEAWKHLSGVVNIYKSEGVSYNQVKNTIITNLCKDLNELPQEPPDKYVSIEGATNKPMSVIVRENYAQNPLITGPSFIHNDFKMEPANFLSYETSGVLVFGINNATKLIHQLRQSKLTNLHKLKGILGQAREFNYKTGKIIEKSTWKHIKREHIDKICATMQASHQRQLFQFCGVDLQSEAAYQLAVKGLIRPTNSNIPAVYSIKCFHFEPPEFTIEIVSIHTNAAYLKQIVAEIGLRLKSCAHCSFIQCSQFGFFSLKDTLLSQQWNLKNIFYNMDICKNMLLENSELINTYQDHLVKPKITDVNSNNI